jgi:ParB-like chromosome segregation protein Spo0J
MTKPHPVGVRAISSLSHDPRNARTHSEAQIEQIAASIAEFGFAVPIAADASGVVRAGNGRLDGVALLLERGQSIRWPDGTPIKDGMIPAVDCSAWTEAQCRAYALADNKIALNAGWDQQILDEELAAIAAMTDDIDLRSITGFDDDEFSASLARLVNIDRQGEDDEVSPPHCCAKPHRCWARNTSADYMEQK